MANTNDSTSVLDHKNTPLAPLTCPRPMREGIATGKHTTTHVVALTGGEAAANSYTCACGEVFLWDDEWHWEVKTV